MVRMTQCLKRLLHLSMRQTSVAKNAELKKPVAPRYLHQGFQEQRDRFGSVTINLGELEPMMDRTDFRDMLEEALSRWRSDRCPAAWLHVPIACSGLIPAAADLGFVFHHAEYHSSVLCQWLDKSSTSKLPRFATHQVGVAGIVINEDTDELLVVQDKHKPWVIWKFPGGLAELGEDLADAAKREVFEETGVKTEFLGVIAFRQQHKQPGAFGRSDLYFLCHMKPLTFDLSPCNIEIEACEWMKVDKLRKHTKQSNITQQLLRVIEYGSKKGFDKVHLVQHQLESIYKKGLTFKLHHCNIGESNDRL